MTEVLEYTVVIGGSQQYPRLCLLCATSVLPMASTAFECLRKKQMVRVAVPVVIVGRAVVHVGSESKLKTPPSLKA